MAGPTGVTGATGFSGVPGVVGQTTPNATGAPAAGSSNSFGIKPFGASQDFIQIPLSNLLHILGLSTTQVDSSGNKNDLSKTVLTYTDPTTGVAAPITKSNFEEAMNQLAASYPNVAAAAASYYDLSFIDTPAAKTGWQNIFTTLEQNNWNFAKVPPLAYQDLNAQITALKNDVQMGITAGLKSVTATQEVNAFDTIQNTIESWNLTPEQKSWMANTVLALITRQGNHLTNVELLTGIMRGQIPSGLGNAVDAKIRQDYEQAYPGLTSYNNQPTANRMNETQYSTYVQAILNSATQYGAPMPTAQEVGELLNHHVSAAEYQQRVTDIYAAVSNADPNVKRLLQTEYGVSQQNLMHYFMNPKVALQTMQRQVASTEIQDYASRVGLTGLSRTGAEQAADMAKLTGTVGNQGLGYGVNQIEQSLLSASRDVALTKNLPGQATPTVDTNTLIAANLAGFQGTNQVVAQTEVARAEQGRAAPFEKGGGYAENQKGVVGLGSARV